MVYIYIYTYIYLPYFTIRIQPNLGKYTNPMHPMGILKLVSAQYHIVGVPRLGTAAFNKEAYKTHWAGWVGEEL